MHEQSTNQQRRSTNDRNDSSGSGLVGPEMGSGSGREEVSRGRNGHGPSGGLHLGLRGLDQVNYWQVLDEIREALVEINQTLKNKL